MFLAESTEGYKLVSEGDVVINTMWAWMGAMGVSPVEGLISPSYGVYAPRGDAFEADYLDLLLRLSAICSRGNPKVQGHPLFKATPLSRCLPRYPIACSFERSTAGNSNGTKGSDRREEQLATLSRLSLGRLREFRAALITAAVTGQVDIATWGKRGTTDRRLDAIEAGVAAQPERQQAQA